MSPAEARAPHDSLYVSASARAPCALVVASVRPRFVDSRCAARELRSCVRSPSVAHWRVQSAFSWLRARALERWPPRRAPPPSSLPPSPPRRRPARRAAPVTPQALAPAADPPFRGEEADRSRLRVGFNVNGGFGSGGGASGAVYGAAFQIGWQFDHLIAVYGRASAFSWSSSTKLSADRAVSATGALGFQLSPLFSLTRASTFEVAAGPSLDGLAHHPQPQQCVVEHKHARGDAAPRTRPSTSGAR